MKNIVASILARFLRAAIARIAGDLELAAKLYITYSTVVFINKHMYKAKPCSSRDEVMQVAINASEEKDGCIIELGVYKGESLNKLAKHFFSKKVYGFDTFTGLPEVWRDGFQKGTFDVSNEKLKFEDNCILYKGLFSDTLPVFIEENTEPAKLIHVDCDLYSSTVSALTILTPKICSGTVMVFDEFFNYQGWESHEFKAFQEFLQFSGYQCEYLAFNKFDQQVALIIR